jgi:hypothetical protein
MFGSVALSSETVNQIVLEDINAHLEHMDKLIGNAERHGEPSVARELSRTMDEITLAVAV